VVERKSRRLLKAVDGVSFEVARGKTFSLVGESGCGKSTVAKCILGLYGMTAGTITFDGVDVHDTASRAAMLPIRRRLQMIFQDPYASLNPRWKVRSIVGEPIRAFRQLKDRNAVAHQVEELLRAVGLTPADAERYPHEFSGGQRQRICIARALALEPEVLIADEAVSALDVSVQAEILQLLDDIQQRLHLTLLFITHDLRVAAQICNRIVVMQHGKVVEEGPVAAVFQAPREAYTRALIEAAPGREFRFGSAAP
jgi:peptide/nickel transport system ATP-binding protein